MPQPKKLFRVIMAGTFKADDELQIQQMCTQYKNLLLIRITHIADENYDPQMEMLVEDINKFLVSIIDDSRLDKIDTEPQTMRMWRYNEEKKTMIIEAKVKNRDDVVALLYLTEDSDDLKLIYCHPSLINNEITWIVKTEHET